MDRHLRLSGDTITAPPIYVNGELTDSEEDVTVQIKDGAGANVGSSATATRASLGVYEHQPSAAQMDLLDTYTAYWTVTLNGEARVLTSQYEVVGGFYFTVQDARNFQPKPEGGSMVGPLSSETRFPTQTIIDAREEIESFIEEVCERAFVLRGRRITLDGDSSSYLLLPDMRPKDVYSVAVTDSAGTVDTYDSTALADIALLEYGAIQRNTLGVFTRGNRNVAVHYTYGESQVPGPIKRAALLMLKNRLLPSDISDRAQSFVNESGTLTYSTPNGQTRWTGLPEVDSILAKYSDNRVGIA